MNRSLLTIALVLPSFVTPLLAEEGWPQFRGKGGAAVAPQGAAIPLEWSADQNLKWKLDLPGPGSSSPIFWGNKLFVICYTGYGVKKEEPGEEEDLGRVLLCVDRATGDVLWKKAIGLENPEDEYRGYIMEHGYASATPVTDGKHVFAFLGKAGLHAFTMDGEKAWSKSIGKMSGDKRWGSAASPILHGDLLIVNAADEARAIIAFDKGSGEERWRYEADKLDLTYNTPTLHQVGDGPPELVISAPEELFALDPKTGKKLWFVESQIPGNVSPSVVSAGEVLFTTGGWPRKGSLAVKGGGSGDVTDKVLWRSKTYSYVPTPIAHEGFLYWVSDDGHAIVMDLASGEVVTKREVDGISGRKQMSFYGSVVRVGDKLVAVSRRNGTFVFELNKEMKQIAQNDLGDRSDFNATPAASKEALYLRSNKALYCISK